MQTALVEAQITQYHQRLLGRFAGVSAVAAVGAQI